LFILEIAKEVRMSFRDIGKILRKADRETEQQQRSQQEKVDEYKPINTSNQELSVYAKAYKLFSENKSPIEVAISLNLRESEVTVLYDEYLKLNRLNKFKILYKTSVMIISNNL
jgi:hypothetical protein